MDDVVVRAARSDQLKCIRFAGVNVIQIQRDHTTPLHTSIRTSAILERRGNVSTNVLTRVPVVFAVRRILSHRLSRDNRIPEALDKRLEGSLFSFPLFLCTASAYRDCVFLHEDHPLSLLSTISKSNSCKYPICKVSFILSTLHSIEPYLQTPAFPL